MNEATKLQDRILVERDDEQIEVWNTVTVQREHHIGPGNSHESFLGNIIKGDGSVRQEPVAVTDRLADFLHAELFINVEDHGIEVIDLEEDDVEVI